MAPKKSCFIIMPITTPAGWLPKYNNDGKHFDHVLSGLFIPAVKRAGLRPISPRASGAGVIHADIIKHLYESDLVLCDISTLNANVFFELGIRTVMDKPVCIVVDDRTKKIPFDINLINFHTYGSALKRQGISNAIENLKDHILTSLQHEGDRNALWKYLGVDRSEVSNQKDSVSVSCPPETFSHEQLIFGSYAPAANRVLRIYVHPHDKSNNYYTQVPKIETAGSWSFLVRFGNPYWRNMAGESPLTYDVFVVLFKPKASFLKREKKLFQIPNGIDFSEKIFFRGATAVKHVIITRHVEKMANFIPQIIHPVVPTDPRENAKVNGKFALKWKPARKMWVELWKNGNEIPGYPERYRDSGTHFNLKTGLYEIKVKEFKESQFCASLWVEVMKP